MFFPGLLKSEVNDITNDLFGSSSSGDKSGGSDVDPVKARKDQEKR